MTGGTKVRNTKIEHFKNLVAVAIADGFWHQNEKKLLQSKADQYGLSTEDIVKILDEAENLKFVVPQNIIDREEQLKDAVHMALIDGFFHKDEYQLCVNLANRLGFSQRSVDQAVEILKSQK